MVDVISDAYYKQLSALMRECTPEDFPSLIDQYRADIRNVGFKDYSNVFKLNLKWFADQLIRKEDGSYKKAEQISDNDLAKLETLRTKYWFDYQRDLRVDHSHTYAYDDTHSKKCDYSLPFLVYCAKKDSDFTEYQAQVYKEAITRISETNLQYDYVIHSKGNSDEHLSRKNLLHILLEKTLHPNKKKIADALFPLLGNKTYREFATVEHKENGLSRTWYISRSALHSAVKSGRLENVQYAVKQGAELKNYYESYDSNPFAEAAKRSADPAYREIAVYLFNVALSQSNSIKILSRPFRTRMSSSYPMEDFARIGDLDMVIALAQAGVGVPIIEVRTFKEEFMRHLDCGIVVPSERKEYLKRETGEIRVFPSIKQATFNLNPERSYSADQNIFDKAIEYLIENKALDANDVPEESLTDPRYLNFVYSLRRVAEEEKECNPSFLNATATFTPEFAAAVKNAKEITQNFEIPYKSPKKAETPSLILRQNLVLKPV